MTTLTAICEPQRIPQGPSRSQLVHLWPAGEIRGRNGRRFQLGNPVSVIRRTRDYGIDPAVDCEHQSVDLNRQKNGPVPAAGWIKELIAKPDGLWGRVEWTARARELIAEREYRYLSPVFTHDARGTVLRLKGAGLVRAPTLERTALSRQEATMNEPDPATDPTDLARIAAALDLPEDAGIEDIRAALVDLTAANRAHDPARYVPIGAVADLMAAHRDQSASMSDREAEARVDAATAAGHITPAMRDWGRSAASRPTASKSSCRLPPHRSRRCSNGSIARACAHPARLMWTPTRPRSAASSISTRARSADFIAGRGRG